MDRATAVQSLATQRAACVAFLDLKRQDNDWQGVAQYAAEIIAIDGKLSLLKQLEDKPNGVQTAANLIKQEAQAIAEKRAQRAQENS